MGYDDRLVTQNNLRQVLEKTKYLNTIKNKIYKETLIQESKEKQEHLQNLLYQKFIFDKVLEMQIDFSKDGGFGYHHISEENIFEHVIILAKNHKKFVPFYWNMSSNKKLQ